jgi:predicted dithiol-disulfide oxidoreductase (DUF899 family)
MATTHDKRLPNESAEYRSARDALLAEEQALRARTESVAEMRRSLPQGGAIGEDYEFEELDLTDGGTRTVRFSELFGDKTDLLVYSYMYGPGWQKPCPSCTSFIDCVDAVASHVRQQAEIAVVAKATPEQLFDIARERNWTDLRLLSCEKNDYARDYNAQPGESSESLLPLMNTFQKDGDAIHHVWASELLWTPIEGGHPRHIDIAWPLWGLLDMTRSGRHPDKSPQLRY